MIKKHFILMLIACLFVFGLAGCASDKSEDPFSIMIPEASGPEAQGTVSARYRQVSVKELSPEIKAELDSYSAEKYSALKMAYPYPYDFYYATLNEAEKDIFDQISIQTTNAHPYAYIETGAGRDTVISVAHKWPWSQIALEQYELNQNFTITDNGDGTYCLRYDTFPCDNAKFEQMVSECASQTSAFTGFYEKEKAIYDWITENIDYDYDFTEENLYRNQTTGSVANGKSVCAGISKFLGLVNKRCGIPSNVVVTAHHAFNYVYFRQVPYLADATWDLKNNGHRWFMIGQKTRDKKDVDSRHSSFDSFVLCPELSADDYLEMWGPSETEEGVDAPDDASDANNTGNADEASDSDAPDSGEKPSDEDQNDNRPVQHRMISRMVVSVTGECYMGGSPKNALTVTVTYNDGTSRELSDEDYQITGSTEQAGDMPFTVCFEDWNIDIHLHVREAGNPSIKGVSVTHCPSYCQGASIRDNTFSVKVLYADGTSRTLSEEEYSVSGSTETLGDATFQVFYKTWVVNFSVTIVPAYK